MGKIDAYAVVNTAVNELSYQPICIGEIGENDVLVKTAYSGVSIGTEFSLISGRLSWGPFPQITGYQGTGVIQATGAAVTGFKEGDWVYFRDGSRVTTEDGTSVTMALGSHSSHALVDTKQTKGLELLPEGVDKKSASLFVLPAVGLYGTNQANPGIGDRVAVFGVGPIGLGVVSACARRGAVVTAIDVVGSRLKVANKLGAAHTIQADGSTEGLQSQLDAVEPFDVVFEASGVKALVDPAISACRKFGTFVWQGNYGVGPISFTFLNAARKQLKMVFPSDDGLEPCRQAIMRSLADGSLRWDLTVTHEITAQELPDFYARVRDKAVPDLICAVVCW